MEKKRRIDPQALDIAVLALRRDVPGLDAVKLYAALTAPAAQAGTAPDPAPAGACLRPSEVAKRLGVSRRTVFNMMKCGALPRVRLGARTVRIPEAALASLTTPVPQGV